jgi:hypothetical protein
VRRGLDWIGLEWSMHLHLPDEFPRRNGMKQQEGKEIKREWEWGKDCRVKGRRSVS